MKNTGAGAKWRGSFVGTKAEQDLYNWEQRQKLREQLSEVYAELLSLKGTDNGPLIDDALLHVGIAICEIARAK